MSIWKIGLTELPLAAITSRRKTIEARLCRGKFAEIAPGDTVRVRQDTINAQGETVDGQSDVLRLMVMTVRRYEDFASLLKQEGYERVIPWADSHQSALRELEVYYTREQQALQGVVAIEVAPQE